MGIAIGALRFLMEEAAARPWSGEVLTLGRQTSSVSAETFERLARECAYEHIPITGAQSEVNLSDRQIFGGLGFDHLMALDASSYENPDVIFDLNHAEIPSEWHRRFDLVFDGGTLEHVFEISTALRTICQVTKTGGRVVHISPLSNCVDHGFYSFSPTLFADFYSANGWVIQRMALARFENDPGSEPWEIRDYQSYDFGRLGALPSGAYFLLACVQSTSKSTFNVIPQQSYYKKAWAT